MPKKEKKGQVWESKRVKVFTHRIGVGKKYQVQIWVNSVDLVLSFISTSRENDQRLIDYFNQLREEGWKLKSTDGNSYVFNRPIEE